MRAPQLPCDALVWVLTVEADRTRRWVSRDCRLTLNGADVAARTGLRSDDRVEDLDSDVPATVIGLRLPAPEAMAAARVARLTVCTLQLVPIRDGVAALEDALDVLGGRVGDVEVDPEAGLCSLGLLALSETATKDLCPVALTVDERTWPNAPESARGARMPRVYGQPGSYEYPTFTDVNSLATYPYGEPDWNKQRTWFAARVSHGAGATPVLPVNMDFVSVHFPAPVNEHIDVETWPDLVLLSCPPVEATSVDLWAVDSEIGLTWATVAVTRGYDGLGRACSVADVSALSLTIRRCGEWWAGWAHGQASDPSLDAVIRSVFVDAGVPVDWQSIEAAGPWLRQFKIGGYIDDSVTATEWAESRLPLYGARLAWSSRGLGVRVVAPQGYATPIAKLTVNGGAVRDAPWRIEPGDLDEVAVQWAPARTVGRTVETVVRRVDGPILHRESVTASEVWDDATAARVGLVALWRHGPKETVGLSLPTERWWWLGVGDVVELVDEGIGEAGGALSRWQVVSCAHTDAPRRSVLLRRVTRDRVKVLGAEERYT